MPKYTKIKEVSNFIHKLSTECFTGKIEINFAQGGIAKVIKTGAVDLSEENNK